MIPSTTHFGEYGLGLASRQDDAPTSSVTKYNGRDIATLPNEVFEKILSNLDSKSVFNCKCVSQTQKEKVTIKHDGSIFSPDEKHLVTISDNRNAKVFKLNDGNWQQRATIQHSSWMSNACFSADGKHLVTVSSDQTAEIFELDDELLLSKATIKHDDMADNTAQICGLDDVLWQNHQTPRMMNQYSSMDLD